MRSRDSARSAATDAADKLEVGTMATSTKKPANTNIPAAWGDDAEELETRILVDKDTLIGQPMKILGFEVERNEKRDYDVMFVYALREDGSEVCFADTSDTGIKGQLQAKAVEKNVDPAAGGGFQKLPLVIWGGLRTHQYEISEGRKAGQMSTTYYLVGKAATAL